jgi:hypothetical protein
MGSVTVLTLLSVSVVLRLTLSVPADVGVPLITPVEELMLKPAGSPVADQTIGVTPPVEVAVKEYAVATVALGSEVVVMLRDGSEDGSLEAAAPFTTREKFLGAEEAPAESVTAIVTVSVSAVVGVPDRAPVDALIESQLPVSGVSAVIAQV